MRFPVMRGVIDRRLLVNFRVDPDVLARTLPAPFRPQFVHGWGMSGICLIRLKSVRPAGFPAWLGISSENAAHRTAVTWEENGSTRSGVYVRRRDTSSSLNAVVGGRLFPGIHHRARFDVLETGDRCDVSLRSLDGSTVVAVSGRRAAELPGSSIFASLDEASRFFEAGSLGYSATPDTTRFQGLELRCRNWTVTPLEVDRVKSSFFDDPVLFPAGSIEFDNALLMRGIEHEWHGRPDLCVPADLTGSAALHETSAR